MSASGRHHADGDRRHRRGPLLGFAVAGALLPLVAAPTASAASVIPEGPLTVRTISPVKGNYINETLQGVVCQAPNTCTEIPYLSFITPFGVARLDNVLKAEANDEPIVIYAYSNGAQIAQHWITDHADDADAPPAENVTFILMGNSTRKYGGADKEFGVSQPSQYHVIDIAREYDPVADFPDNGLNLLAVANALSGFITLHDYRDVDINDPNNIVWDEGNTTYVLVPTENLPLLNPLRLIGLNALADQLNGPLKEIVDQGYDRSYIPEDARPTPTVATAVAAKTPVAEPDPAPVQATTKKAAVTTEAVKSAPEPDSDVEGDVQEAKPAKSTTTSTKDDDVADAVRSITTTATRELKKLTEPLKSLRPSRASADDASSSSKPSSRDSGSSDRSSAGGDSGQ
ncbi:PE-PPE domain-containing protein [Mycolicibacterium chubuense]|uniref:Putative PPE family protein PPE42 n=1 Tax=Mycolicibacterium chubuense TaxID=1800 RepID=A0A0J6WPV3_MYCCU|nr:PE-PPE domain-containing protein [Mycolicibacterium chubuense]KMO84138.1 putative PPE family protein PPE42 [Mycolicibacterium chubuense]ORA51913.1 PE-PPE domain-containing protein [Mycolicibacterium chubuense]SPX99838.1 transcriptional regulator [Mycolicibacterium chubuense]